MYQIVQSPNEILRTATKPVTFFDEKLQKIIEEMRVTLLVQKHPEGVGLAANQVDLPYCLFLARFTTSRKEPIRVFINPEIIEHSADFQIETKKSPLEGCLSLPKYYGLVKRYEWIKLKYQSIENFKFQIENFSGFPAVVIQHEMDHLNGKIFVEKIIEQKGKMYKITGKDSEGKEEWEEVEL
ncbi:MAG: peptide deformylase [bacterium]|nr:peptide deformylase [bacterium]